MKNNIEYYVKEIIKDNQSHGIAHVNRVVELALKFANVEKANKEIVILASYLHDVDDYKFFGEKNAKGLINAKYILDELDVKIDIKNKVLDIITKMGYNKYLDGIRPNTIEGMIVSDSDMCDAIGVNGILRTYNYSMMNGIPFFDKKILPDNNIISASQYRNKKNAHSLQHFFDKLLLIPKIMMTESGKNESCRRIIIMVDFLKQLFKEEDSQVWSEYLENFLCQHNLFDLY